MKLRTCSAALVAITLGTSAWAEDISLEATRVVNCPGETFVAQLCESDLTRAGQTALAVPELAPEAHPTGVIVDRIAQSTVLIGSGWLPLVDGEGTTVASSFGSDPSDVTASVSVVPELAPEADPVAAVVDRIAQSTVSFGIGSLPLINEEGTTVASGFGSDPSEVTGSILPVEVALDGFEDR